MSDSTGDDGPTDDRRAPGDGDTRSSVWEPPVEDHKVDIDQVFEILKNQRRRHVLRYLDAVDGEVPLSELAERIAAWESDKEVGRITSQERKRVYVELYQCHLPKMDDVDAVAYNKQRGRIARGENAALFCHYLPGECLPGAEAGENEDRHWCPSLLMDAWDRMR